MLYIPHGITAVGRASALTREARTELRELHLKFKDLQVYSGLVVQ